MSTPGTTEQHFSQAKNYLAKGERALAVREYDRIIAIRANAADDYARRGHILAELNEPGPAMKDFDLELPSLIQSMRTKTGDIRL